MAITQNFRLGYCVKESLKGMLSDRENKGKKRCHNLRSASNTGNKKAAVISAAFYIL